MTIRIIDRITGAVIGALALALIAILAVQVDAGPLDPSGPPGSTDGVLEPGTPISSLPFQTTGPGYYYLTRNLTGTAGNSGITIAGSDVTLDLKGFRLQGVGSSLHGVTLGGFANITILNGTITGWGGSAILFSSPTFSNGSHIHDLHVSGNGGYGIRAGDRAIIHDVTSRDNGLDGIAASRDAVVQRCSVFSNDGAGINAPFNASITDCIVKDSSGDGINAGQGSVVRDNVVTNNGGDGVQISSTSVVEANDLFSNGQQILDGAGVHATGGGNRITSNLMVLNDRGIWAESIGSLIMGNHANNNADDYGQIAFGNVMGPTLTATTADDAGANPHANFGTPP